jgi:hypothetical protein
MFWISSLSWQACFMIAQHTTNSLSHHDICFLFPSLLVPPHTRRALLHLPPCNHSVIHQPESGQLTPENQWQSPSHVVVLAGKLVSILYCLLATAPATCNCFGINLTYSSEGKYNASTWGKMQCCPIQHFAGKWCVPLFVCINCAM